MLYPNWATRFRDTFINKSRYDATLSGAIFDPPQEVNSFEQVVRLVRFPLGSEVSPSHLVFHLGDYYYLIYHSRGQTTLTFRLLPARDMVNWSRATNRVVDNVTGLVKPGSFTPPEAVPMFKHVQRFEPSVDQFRKPVTRFVCNKALLKEGDTLDGVLVRRVWIESGLTIAET